VKYNELDRIMREVLKEYEARLREDEFGPDAKRHAEHIRSLHKETREK